MESPFEMSFNELMAAMDYWEYRQRWAAKERHTLVAKGGWSAADEAQANYLDRLTADIATYLADCRDALAEGF